MLRSCEWLPERFGGVNSSRSTIAKAAGHAEPRRQHQRDYRQGIGGDRTQLDASELPDQQLNVRRRIDEAQARANLPVPVSEGTVSPTVAKAQHEPRRRGERDRGELPRAGASPDPPGADEDNPRRMEHEEGDVQRLIHCDASTPGLQRFGNFACDLISRIWRM